MLAIHSTDSSFKALMLVVFSLLLNFPASAQWAGSTSITLDGNNNEAPYVDSSNWSICWDDNYVYLVKKGGQSSEPAIVYFDIDPVFPVTWGTNSDGSVTGETDHGITPNSGFRADLRLYWLPGSASYKTRDGSNGWSTSGTSIASSNLGSSGSDREIRIRWDSFPGLSGRPSKFNFFAFASTTASTGYSYDATPTGNPSGGTYATPTCEYYWRCNNTSSSSTHDPFQYRCYTYLGTGGALGTLSNIHDFTVNRSGITINKSDKWTISGWFCIADGTVEFDRNDDSLIITDSLVTMGTGKLLLDTSSSIIWVKQHVNNRSTSSGVDFAMSNNDSSTLIIGGNFRNTADLDSDRTTVRFHDHKVTHVLQTVIGNFSGSNHLWEVSVNNASGIRLAVTDSLVVEQHLTFNQGVIDVDSAKYLRLRRSCQVTNTGGPADGKFVSGNLVREKYDTSNFLFHVGAGNRMARVALRPDAAATGRIYTVKYFNSGHQYSGTSSALRGTPANSLDHASYTEYWMILCNHSTDDAFITLYWTSNSYVSATNAHWDSLRVCRWIGGSTNEWETQGSSVTALGSGSDNGRIIAPDSTTDFSDRYFTIGTVTVNNSLPVELLHQEIIRTGEDHAVINWSTASEVNCSHYEIWKVDMEPKILLGKVGGSGTSQQISKYQYDLEVGDKTELIRLKQVDQNGVFTWFPILILEALPSKRNQIGLSLDSESGTLHIQGDINSVTNIKIFNLRGQVCSESLNRSSIGTSELPSGVYILEVSTSTNSKFFKFINP